MADQPEEQGHQRFSSYNLRPNSKTIKAIREKANISQAEFAEKINVSRVMVSLYERGKSGIGRDTANRIAAEFDVPFEDVVVDGSQEQTFGLPDTLPPEPDLIGRDDQLEAVKKRLFAEDKRNRFALRGIPGVGKTAMALKLVYDDEVQRHFTDGILWAGLGQSGNVLAQLGIWAGKIGISREAMEKLTTIEQRAREIRATIGNRRMLLVVDDVWQEKAASDFYVGGPRCVHLITTRSPKVAVKFAGKGGAIPVIELTEDDGLELLGRWAEKTVDTEPEAARELVRAVGCLPLALILMGKYLEVEEQPGPPGRIQRALERLQSAEERLRTEEPQLPLEQHTSLPEGAYISLKAVIQISEDILEGDVRGALRALSVFPAKPNTFSEEAALAVTVVLNEVVYKLVDVGLLETSAQGRYFLHQTISDYAGEKLTEIKAFERMSDYFQDYLQRYQDNYNTVEVEQENVRAILQWSMESRRFDSAANLVIPFFEFLESRGLYNQAYKMTREVVKTAHEEDIADTLPLLLRNMGRVERYQGNTAKAREIYLAGLSKAKERDDKKIQAMLLMSVGATYCDAGEFEESIPYFEDGLQLARTIGHHETMCDLLQNLGFVEEYIGNYDTAEEYLKEGLALAHEMGHDEQLCTALMHIGRVAEDRGAYEQAEAYYQEGLALAQEMKHQARICALLACLGTVVFRRGVQHQGEIYLKDSLSLAREIEYHDMICMLLENLGVIEMERGAYDQAKEYFNEGLSLAREMGYRDKVCSLLAPLGATLSSQGEYEHAEECCHEGLALAREMKHQEMMSTFLTTLGATLFSQGEYDRAEKYLQDGLTLAREIENSYLISGSLIAWGKLNLKQDNWDLAISVFGEALDIAKKSGDLKIVAEANYGIGQVEFSRGNIERARELGQESLSVSKTLEHIDAAEVKKWLDSLPVAELSE